VRVVAPMMMVTIPGLRRLVAQNAGLGAQLRAAHDGGDWIAACGTGLWILGRAGLLQHQPAPLPWLYQSGFAKDFPETPISSETPLIVGPHMVLASAPNLIFEMMLTLLDGVGLSDLSSACRDKFVTNPERQHLILNIPEQVVGTSRDAPLHRALAFIESNAGRPLTVSDMASAAAVSERTLLRLFDRHIERSPLQFLHELRVKRAKMWLEATWRSVIEIAESSGYADVSTFRRTFKRIAGMSPSEYRLRYTIRTPRAVWQLQEFEDVPSSTARLPDRSLGKRRSVDRK
jgi:transcriptional regulator GlxA family with amidase domain